jgi:hypothetical protein
MPVVNLSAKNDMNLRSNAPKAASTGLSFIVNTSFKSAGSRVPRESKANEQQRAIISSVIQSLTCPSRKITIGNALAGSGKTSTSIELAHELAALSKDMLYLVFAKRNATEAKEKFPSNTKPMTAHGFAFSSKHPDANGSMASVYKDRIAGNLYGALRDLSRSPSWRERFEQASSEFRLRSSRVNSALISAIHGILENYCQSSDDEISVKHLSDETAFHVRNRLTDKPECPHLLSIAKAVFSEMRDPESDFPVDHGFYLKLCSLHPPRINRSLIVLDEAQDANPAMLKIIESQLQYGTSLLFIGDTNQHVYSFTGAVDAMAVMRQKYPSQTEVHPLTGSYRFGQPVADVGNSVLALMGYPHDGQGLSTQPTSVSDAVPDFSGATVLYRTNMSILSDIMGQFKQMDYHIVGGVKKEAENLLAGLSELYAEGRSSHKELSVFESWAELVEFASTSAGSSIRPIVDYVAENSGQVTKAMAALARAKVNESEAEVVLSTAHKAKGLQWPKVILSRDMANMFEVQSDGEIVFPEPDDLALLYVAVTRAEKELCTNGVMGAMLRCAQQANINPATYAKKGWALPDVKRSYERLNAAMNLSIPAELNEPIAPIGEDREGSQKEAAFDRYRMNDLFA